MSGVSYVDSATGASGTEATSTNQATQITLETAIRDRIGEVQASPTSNTVLDRLKALLTGIVLAAGANRIGKVTVRASSDGADIDPVAESTFPSRIGEVQASPTSNTVLDRLKALLTGIVLAAGANRIGKVTVRASSDGADIDPVAESTFTSRIGEVQVSTTSNTVLDRLKALLTGIVLAAGANRIGKVTVRASSDGADIDPVAESTFTSRIGEVQASPTTNTVLGRLKALLTGIILAAGENHIGEVGGRSIRVSSSFTRPADTALHATGDNMADSTSAPTVNTITGCARVNGGSGVILG